MTLIIDHIIIHLRLNINGEEKEFTFKLEPTDNTHHRETQWNLNIVNESSRENETFEVPYHEGRFPQVVVEMGSILNDLRSSENKETLRKLAKVGIDSDKVIKELSPNIGGN